MKPDCRMMQPPPTIKEGIYRRPLPENLIAFASSSGRQIFKEALASGGLENYFSLIQQFYTQDEPTFCGISSLVMVLNAMEIDPGRLWKGPWRWYDEALVDCCDKIPTIREEGINLETMSGLAQCNDMDAEIVYQENITLDEFRKTLQDVCTTPADYHMIASYSRDSLGQTGEGHFSPVGAYHQERDLVLILDVARFKYPPHWVPLELLWHAMSARDDTTNKSRGYLLCKKRVLD